VLLLLWFYATPISTRSIEFPQASGWLTVNPMTAFVEAHRAVVLRQQMPDWPVLCGWALGSLFVL
jgi:ABC-type polysaccharide/polyol phosphate export permease